MDEAKWLDEMFEQRIDLLLQERLVSGKDDAPRMGHASCHGDPFRQAVVCLVSIAGEISLELGIPPDDIPPGFFRIGRGPSGVSRCIHQ